MEKRRAILHKIKLSKVFKAASTAISNPLTDPTSQFLKLSSIYNEIFPMVPEKFKDLAFPPVPVTAPVWNIISEEELIYNQCN